MSLVGTRPPTVDEWELYEPHHRARMSFRPGLTGMWQVSGRSNITDFEEVVKLDTQYMDYSIHDAIEGSKIDQMRIRITQSTIVLWEDYLLLLGTIIKA